MGEESVSAGERCRRLLRQFAGTGMLPPGNSEDTLLKKLLPHAEEYPDSDDLVVLSELHYRLSTHPDSEFIYEDESYEEFLAPILPLSRDVLGDVKVKSEVDGEKGTATIFLRAGDREYSFEMEQSGDWVNYDELFYGLNQFAKGCGYTFWSIDADDGVAGFLRDEDAQFLRKRGYTLYEGELHVAPDPCPRCGSREEGIVAPGGKSSNCEDCGHEIPVVPGAELESPFPPDVHARFMEVFREHWRKDAELSPCMDANRTAAGKAFGGVFVSIGRNREIDVHYVARYPWTEMDAAQAERDIVAASEFYIKGFPDLRFHFHAPVPVPPDLRFQFGPSRPARFELKARLCFPKGRELRAGDMDTLWNNIQSSGLAQILGIPKDPSMREAIEAIEKTLIHRLRPLPDHEPPKGWAPRAALVVISSLLGVVFRGIKGIEGAWVDDDGCISSIGMKLRNTKTGFEHVLDLPGGLTQIYREGERGALAAYMAGAIRAVQASRPPAKDAAVAGARVSRRGIMIGGFLAAVVAATLGTLKYAAKKEEQEERRPNAPPEPEPDLITLAPGKTWSGREVFQEQRVFTMRIAVRKGACKASMVQYDPFSEEGAEETGKRESDALEIRQGETRDLTHRVENGFYTWAIWNDGAEQVYLKVTFVGREFSGAPR